MFPNRFCCWVSLTALETMMSLALDRAPSWMPFQPGRCPVELDEKSAAANSCVHAVKNAENSSSRRCLIEHLQAKDHIFVDGAGAGLPPAQLHTSLSGRTCPNRSRSRREFCSFRGDRSRRRVRGALQFCRRQLKRGVGRDSKESSSLPQRKSKQNFTHLPSQTEERLFSAWSRSVSRTDRAG